MGGETVVEWINLHKGRNTALCEINLNKVWQCTLISYIICWCIYMTQKSKLCENKQSLYSFCSGLCSSRILLLSTWVQLRHFFTLSERAQFRGMKKHGLAPCDKGKLKTHRNPGEKVKITGEREGDIQKLCHFLCISSSWHFSARKQ